MDRSTINKLKQSKTTTTNVDDSALDVRLISEDLTTSANVDAPTISITQPTKIVTIRDHSKLKNLDFLNSGHTGFAGIELGTTSQWNSMIDYRPPKGMLIVYTDYRVKNGEFIPALKIGNGNAYLIDLAFLGDDIRLDLLNHLNEVGIHVSEEDRIRWDNKLNYIDPTDDTLEFTRD